MKSFLKNCFIRQRHGDGVMFTATGENIIASLDGYAILPMEDFNHMMELAEMGGGVMASQLIANAAAAGKGGAAAPVEEKQS